MGRNNVILLDVRKEGERLFKCGHAGCDFVYKQKQSAHRHAKDDKHPNHRKCFHNNGTSKCKLCRKRSENLERLLKECNVGGGNQVANAKILRLNHNKQLACIHTCKLQHKCIPTRCDRTFRWHRASEKHHPDCKNDPDCPGHKYIAKVTARDKPALKTLTPIVNFLQTIHAKEVGKKRKPRVIKASQVHAHGGACDLEVALDGARYFAHKSWGRDVAKRRDIAVSVLTHLADTPDIGEAIERLGIGSRFRSTKDMYEFQTRFGIALGDMSGVSKSLTQPNGTTYMITQYRNDQRKAQPKLENAADERSSWWDFDSIVHPMIEEARKKHPGRRPTIVFKLDEAQMTNKHQSLTTVGVAMPDLGTRAHVMSPQAFELLYVSKDPESTALYCNLPFFDKLQTLLLDQAVTIGGKRIAINVQISCDLKAACILLGIKQVWRANNGCLHCWMQSDDMTRTAMARKTEDHNDIVNEYLANGTLAFKPVPGESAEQKKRREELKKLASGYSEPFLLLPAGHKIGEFILFDALHVYINIGRLIVDRLLQGFIKEDETADVIRELVDFFRSCGVYYEKYPKQRKTLLEYNEKTIWRYENYIKLFEQRKQLMDIMAKGKELTAHKSKQKGTEQLMRNILDRIAEMFVVMEYDKDENDDVVLPFERTYDQYVAKGREMGKWFTAVFGKPKWTQYLHDLIEHVPETFGKIKWTRFGNWDIEGTHALIKRDKKANYAKSHFTETVLRTTKEKNAIAPKPRSREAQRARHESSEKATKRRQPHMTRLN